MYILFAVGDNPLPPGHNPMHNGPSSEPPVSLATSRPCGMSSCLNVIINLFISLRN